MTQVKLTSLQAPHGTTYESLRIEHERGIVGRIVDGPDDLGYYKVCFPTVPDGRSVEVHRSMVTFVRS